jgi:hypothetical protein
MANTTATIPASNTAGNNQTTPKTASAATTTSTSSSSTPYSTSSVAGSAGSTSSNYANTLKQYTDIYGKGVGTDLANLLSSIGGTNSATLQEFIASLQPQMAKAQADVNATLGAGGVSANSSVAAIADASLQAQDTATIAGESAQLTQSGQELEASILTGTEHDAAAEVSSSGWGVLGGVLSAGAQVAPSIIKAVKGQ